MHATSSATAPQAARAAPRPPEGLSPVKGTQDRTRRDQGIAGRRSPLEKVRKGNRTGAGTARFRGWRGTLIIHCTSLTKRKVYGLRTVVVSRDLMDVLGICGESRLEKSRVTKM